MARSTAMGARPAAPAVPGAAARSLMTLRSASLRVVATRCAIRPRRVHPALLSARPSARRGLAANTSSTRRPCLSKASEAASAHPSRAPGGCTGVPFVAVRRGTGDPLRDEPA